MYLGGVKFRPALCKTQKNIHLHKNVLTICIVAETLMILAIHHTTFYAQQQQLRHKAKYKYT